MKTKPLPLRGGVHPVVFNVNDHDLTFRNDGPAGTRTVLGRLRQNPYTVANMTTARNNISVSPSAQPLRPRLWERLLPIQDYVGVVNGPFFNNISINYNMWTEQNSQAHRFWGAASTNNALHEFHDNAANDGIFPPPSNLDLYISTGSASGFALMTRFLDPDDIATLSFNSITSATSIWGNFTTIAAIGSAVSTSVLRLVLPDVMIGADFVTSDRHRALAFHELSHASHFVRAGAPFWTDLAVAEIQADFAVGHPWGLSTSPEAGRIALCESWAEHIGWTYTHRKYGDNNTIDDTWDFRLERTRNFRPNHIPIGIYHDLADTGTEPLSRDVLGGGSGVVADAVSGFTIAQMYGLFTPVMVSPTQYRDALIAGPLSSTSNTAAQVLNLFGSY